jgi:hypothetical protein
MNTAGTTTRPIARPRRLTLADAMLLVAATAVGIGSTRHVWKSWGYPWFWQLNLGWGAGPVFARFLTVSALCLPGLAAGTAAVLAVRLRRPRPPLRLVALQPGAAACAAALVVVALETLGEAASMLYFEWSRGYLGSTLGAAGVLGWWHVHVLIWVPYPVSYAILAAWATLAFSRRCRPEPSAIDRAGRFLGACWVALALLFWLNRHFLDAWLPGALSR